MAKINVHIDFETRSTVDLRKAGAHVYALDKTTDALCMAYAINDNDVKLWRPGQAFPYELKQIVQNPNSIFIAHNAAFEFLIWNGVCRRYGWPQMPISKFDCTMVRAYSMGLPGTLEAASNATGMPYKKDMKGHRVMLQLCKPRKICLKTGKITWWNAEDSTPKLDIKEKYKALYRYCIQDIIVERELDKRLLHLSNSERNIWLLDQKINYRGVYLDENAARKAIIVVKKEKEKANEAINNLTGGMVSTCNASVALRDWIQLQGFDCETVQKAEVMDLLALDSLPDKVRSALLLRQEASKSSTSKLQAMITSKSSDGRVRGCFQYYGAASTGRWAGRRIQLQNLKRPTISQNEIEDIMERLAKVPPDEASEYLNIFHGSAIDPITSCIRAMLRSAPGKKLVACDFSAIEGRVLAWLAGQESALNVYRTHGKMYEHTAGEIYGVAIDKVNKAQRLIGKVANLALGFQGGVGAFQSMAKVYFIKVPDAQADEIKVRWRNANQRIVRFWYDLENAAQAATQNPNKKFACGVQGRLITFLRKGSFLFCRLPSGRTICYPYPKLQEVKTPWGEQKIALTYKGMVYNNFCTRVAYGGLIAENVTQATARDLLAEALVRVESRGYPVILHVHDEIVTEVSKNFGSVKELENIMCELPEWVTDLPISAEGWQGERYRK